LLYAYVWDGSLTEAQWIAATYTDGVISFTSTEENIGKVIVARMNPTGFTNPTFESDICWNKSADLIISNKTAAYSEA